MWGQAEKGEGMKKHRLPVPVSREGVMHSSGSSQ